MINAFRNGFGFRIPNEELKHNIDPSVQLAEPSFRIPNEELKLGNEQYAKEMGE